MGKTIAQELIEEGEARREEERRRQEQRRCEACGRPLGFLDRLAGRRRCQRCR